MLFMGYLGSTKSTEELPASFGVVALKLICIKVHDANYGRMLEPEEELGIYI